MAKRVLRSVQRLKKKGKSLCIQKALYSRAEGHTG